MIRFVLQIAIGLAIFLPTFLNAQDLENGYGRARGGNYSRSVSGTASLMQMFRDKGHRVSTWGKLSPRIEEFDTILWFPDDYEPPDLEVVARIEAWLEEGNYGWGQDDRTFVYVARDFNAELLYWRAILPNATIENKGTIERKIAQGVNEETSDRGILAPTASCEWFELERLLDEKEVNGLKGRWARGVDGSKVDIRIRSTIDHEDLDDDSGEYYTPELRTLLESRAGDAIVIEITHEEYWGNGKILIVVNGSFLLNLGLVNQENRKLAMKVVDSCASGSDVLFLESGKGGIQVSNVEAVDDSTRLQDWMQKWPLNFMVYHLLALGFVFMFAFFPIFGRPRELPSEQSSDFGKHIESLGDLVRLTKNQEYAVSQLKYYEENVKRDPGRTHGRRK